jgi:hypothetical protein
MEINILNGGIDTIAEVFGGILPMLLGMWH